MDGYLKQSTAQRVVFGPFVSSLDAHTRQTGLTIASSDIMLSKAGADYHKSNSSKGGYHDTNGNYWATLDSTDTNTVGTLKYDIDINAAMSVFGAYTVLSRERWNQLYASTDTLPANVTLLGGSAVQQTGGHIHAFDDGGNALATLAATSTLDRAAVRDSVIDDSTRLDGSRLNTCSTLDRGGITASVASTLDRSKIRDSIVDDSTRLDGSRLNVCSTLDRGGITASVASTLDRSKIRDSIIDDSTRLDGSRLNTCSTMDRAAARGALDQAMPAIPVGDSLYDYVQRTKYVTVNKMIIQETTATTDIYKDDDATSYCSIAAAFTSTSLTTTRKKLE